MKQFFPAPPESPSSPLGEALADNELRFLIRNGGWRRAVEVLDKAMYAHPDLESDPEYVPFMETLGLVLHEGENFIQADVILDRLKAHLREHGIMPSPAVGALELSLRNSPIYRLQGMIDPEISGIEP